MSKIITYYNTIKYLKPIQVASRIRQKFIDKSKPVDKGWSYTTQDIGIMIPELDLDKEYVSRFAPEKICSDFSVRLLNEDVPIDFSHEALSKLKPLIRFNLEYFEFAIALGAKYRETKEEKYLNAFVKAYTEFLKSDVKYAAYVISLHIPNLLIALELFGDKVDRAEISKELYRQYKWLISHQELHLLGNHYFENLKAIIIASFYFGELDICTEYCKKLAKEVREQILLDGFHYELSPMYHKIILEDLLRIYQISSGNGFPKCEWLKPTIISMINAMASLENGFNRTPLFNDAGDNVAKSKKALILFAEHYINVKPRDDVVLENAGYYKLYKDDLSLIMDVGSIGPSYMPGHGHCDCLSFELAYGGEPVFVNSGTYEYQGEHRKYFRSTEAHNTFRIDNREQSQCWGEHRVGKRISDITAVLDENRIRGSCKTADGDLLAREIHLEGNELVVHDETRTNGKYVYSWLHVSADYECEKDKQQICVYKDEKLICTVIAISSDFDITPNTPYAADFGRMDSSTTIQFRWQADSNQHGYRVKFSKE